MAGAIRMKPETSIQEGQRIILVDDVYTTGATLFAACDALRQAGARTVYCATFARVP
jgi:predicted amidophosphoribosyltransferase